MSTAVAALLLLLVQDLDQVLQKADQLLEEAKSGYEQAKEKGSAEGFTAAGFKLEDARLKYLAVQEFAKDAQLKVVQERLRSVGQLSKLIHDGKVAISGTPAPAPPPPPPPPAAAPEPAAPALPKAARVAPPDAARIREAEKVVRDLYKVEYAKKPPADRQALARKLLQEGLRVRDDPTARWVMLREAQDLAAQVLDLETALEALQGTAEFFEMDVVAAKSALLGTLTRAARTPEDSARLAEQYLKFADEAVAADSYEAADKAVGAALAAARKSNSTTLMLRATSRTREIGDLKARFDRIRKAYDALAKNPADPAANLEIGLFLCLSKGEWESGIVFLSKGGDAVYAPVADKDLLSPSEPARQIEIADAWWDLAEKEKTDARKQRLVARSAHWYRRASTGASGLALARVQQRLELLRKRALSVGLTCILGPKAEAKGIEFRFNDDGKSEAATIGGKSCIKFVHPGGDNPATYLYFDVVEPWEETWATEVEVEYFDDGNNIFDLEYDGVSAPYKNAGKTVTVGNSKTWKTVVFSLPDPAFRNRLNAACDIRIRRTSGNDGYLHRVTLRLAAIPK